MARDFRFDAQVTKPGRTISVVDAQALQYAANGDEQLIATMTATVMTVTERDGIRH